MSKKPPSVTSYIAIFALLVCQDVTFAQAEPDQKEQVREDVEPEMFRPDWWWGLHCGDIVVVRGTLKIPANPDSIKISWKGAGGAQNRNEIDMTLLRGTLTVSEFLYVSPTALIEVASLQTEVEQGTAEWSVLLRNVVWQRESSADAHTEEGVYIARVQTVILGHPYLCDYSVPTKCIEEARNILQARVLREEKVAAFDPFTEEDSDQKGMDK